MSPKRTDAVERSVVAVVTQHGADPHVVDAAIATARERGAPLVFYVHDATHRFETVRPTFWSADVAPATLLSAVDLERCGEHATALLVARATAAGVTAYGVLGEIPGARGVSAATGRQHAEAVVVDPAEQALVAPLTSWTRVPGDGAVVLTH